MKELLQEPRRLFPVLLAAFVLFAGAYSFTVPLGEAPDEVSHFAYIQYLSSHRELPPPEGPAAGESHQPPLYYVIGALSTSWIEEVKFLVIANPDYVLDNPQTPNLLVHTRSEAFPYQGTALAWHLARLLSVVMGAITVWGTWRIALILFGDAEWLALGAAAIVAFLPEFTFISGMVNNDNLVVMFSTLGVLQLIRMRDSPWSKRESIALGFILGLAAITKLSGLVLWPFAVVVLLLWAARSGSYWVAVLHSTLSLGAATLIASPWFAYNLIHFGDPLGWSKVIALTPQRQAAMGPIDWLSVAEGLFTSFAGRFGGALQLHLPDVYYWVFGVGLLVALLGGLVYAVDARDPRFPHRMRDGLLLSAIFWFLLLIAYVRWTTTVLGTDQARQLFPGLALVAILLTAGAARVARGRARGVTLALTGAGIALAIAILIYLNGLYRPQPTFAQIDNQQTYSDFGQVIRVLSYRIDRSSVRPGEAISVQIEWQALKEPAEDYWLLLELQGPDGAVADKDGIPSAGRQTTDWWLTGEVQSSVHALLVPADVKTGNYTLFLGLHPFGRWDWLRIQGQDKLPLGKIRVMAATGG
jgi:4-amino-4-deoxy-L-arabinose transferase-like glycosyltransferase